MRINRRLGSAMGPLLAGALALSLYAATAAPGLTWAHQGADGGDLMAAAANLGVPHPSGYPTYCLLARAFTAICQFLAPDQSIARHYNLFSATAAALSVSLVYLCARQELQMLDAKLAQIPTEGLSLCAALLWASGATIWSQALITEVYALTAFFAALVLYLVLRIGYAPLARDVSQARSGVQRWRAVWLWLGLGLALGLGLGAHLTLALVAPGLLVYIWPRRSARGLAALAFGGFVGAAIYLYLPLAARQDPPVNWGNPQTWDGFWWLVSGRLYHGYLFGLPLGDLSARMIAYLGRLRNEFTPLGLALALLGLALPARSGPGRVGGLLILGLCSLYAIGYNTTDSYLYLTPGYLIVILWFCQGAALTIAGIARWRPDCDRLARVLAMLFALALPLVSVALNYRDLDVRGDQQAREWIDQAAELPRGALLITGADAHTFAMDYMLWVEKERQDLVVIDGELLPEPWYRRQLAVRYPGIEIPGGPLIEIVQVLSADRLLFLSRPRPELDERYEMRPWGELWQLRERA